MNLRTLVAAVLRVWLTGLSVFAFASTVGAVPVVTDCPGGSCNLQELLDGSSITIGDKLFHNFSNFSSTAAEGVFNTPLQTGLPLVAGNIRVTSQEDLGASGVAGEIGLLFDFGIASPLAAILAGGNTLTIGWEYDVTVVGGNNAIVDNTLMFPGGDIPGAAGQSSANTALGASLQVQEQVTNAAGERVYGKTTVHMDCIDPVTTLDRVTLPSGFSPQRPNIIEVQRLSDERGLHHTVLTLS